MSSDNTKSIRDEIFKDIKNKFGLNIIGFSKIELGYMNLKWKIKTEIGDLFVKQYNKTRYPVEMIPGLKTSLNHQNHLYHEGVLCPKLYSQEGKYVLKSPSGEHFVLMEICDGNNIAAGTANEQQMNSLGQTIGKMHKMLNNYNTDQLPLHWNLRPKESMLEKWKERWEEAVRLDCSRTLSNWKVQRRILEKNDLHIFSECQKGWGHWDLFVDNILFHTDSVSAILDFDRMNYDYLDFDISRPILSCCLDNGQLNIDSAFAIVKGYREYNALTIEQLVRSIKLTWWKEAEWVKVEKMQRSLPLKRFIKENLWVGNNWDDLESLFANIH